MKLLREYIRLLLIETAIGQCYPHVVKMAKDSSQEEFSDLTKFKVAHGRVTDKFSGESYLHAWVEKGDMIFDWQTYNTKPGGIDRETYYNMFQPEIHNEYTAEETMVNCLKSGQAGPWTLTEAVVFKHKGSSNYFRVELPNIGYAEGGSQLRFPDCQSDVDALMKTSEYIEAEKKYVANAKPRTDIVKNEETGQYEEVEIGQAIFRPKFYDVNNAWINNPENRGKGYGKEIYKAFIDKAVEYSRSHGGVFVGAHHCTIGSGTSEDAKRVWASLAREYNSSGDVIFIGL